MFDEKPNRKPCGFVVVKPTRILSAIVERHEPKKSYLTDELVRRLTPISIRCQNKIIDYESIHFRFDLNIIGTYHQHKWVL